MADRFGGGHHPPLVAAGLMLPDACTGKDFTWQCETVWSLFFDQAQMEMPFSTRLNGIS
jgi:hypothetical protein